MAVQTMNVVRQMEGAHKEVHYGMPRNPFWERMSERFPFVDKKELADSGDTFLITRVRYAAQGKYGPQWFLTILREDASDPDGYQTLTLTFPATQGRENFFNELRSEVETNPIPAVLIVFATKNGEAYGLGEPPEDAQPPLFTYSESEPNF